MLKEKYQDEREFEFTAQDFARVRKLIYQHAGISLSDAKTDMVYSRIGRRLRAVGHDSFKQYLDDLEKNQNPDEWEAFTSFYR
jgi:chemotaxis protein methyltransferase CheR